MKIYIYTHTYVYIHIYLYIYIYVHIHYYQIGVPQEKPVPSDDESSGLQPTSWNKSVATWPRSSPTKDSRGQLAPMFLDLWGKTPWEIWAFKMVLARKDGLIYRNVKDGKTGQLWFFFGDDIRDWTQNFLGWNGAVAQQVGFFNRAVAHCWNRSMGTHGDPWGPIGMGSGWSPVGAWWLGDYPAW